MEAVGGGKLFLMSEVPLYTGAGPVARNAPQPSQHRVRRALDLLFFVSTILLLSSLVISDPHFETGPPQYTYPD